MEAAMSFVQQSENEHLRSEIPHKLIASDRVEGTIVCHTDTGRKIGAIERLMIDKITGQVAYAVMTFGGFLGFGERHYPIAWSALKYDPLTGGYLTDITPEQLKNAATDDADETFDWGDRRQEEVTRRYSRYAGY
jgi:hypothetical protein